MTRTKQDKDKGAEEAGAMLPAVQAGDLPVAADAGQKKQPVITLATKITIVRLCMLPIILFFYVGASIFEQASFLYQYGKLIALVLFIIAAVTDFVDGYIARKYNQVTDLGKLLDPIADKLLTVLGFVLVITDTELLATADYPAGMLPIWFAVVVFFVCTARDYINNVLRQLAATKGVVYAANWSGKIRTTVIYFALSFVMFYAFQSAVNFNILGLGVALDVYEYVCLFLLSLSAVLSIYSTYDYVVQYFKKIEEHGKG